MRRPSRLLLSPILLHVLVVPCRDAVGWKFTIYEDLVDHQIVINSQKFGYMDYKKLVYGNKESGPVTFKITTKQGGPVRTPHRPLSATLLI